MQSLTEIPFYFQRKGSRLFAVLHEPTGAGPGKGRGILFCAPFAEEASLSQRVCVDFARVLAGRGYHVFRFDYCGCGESEGEFEGVTLTGHMADIRRAIHLFRQRTGVRVGLFGLRLGGSLAAMVAADEPQIESLVLWEPIARPSEHLKNLIRMQVVADNVLAGRVVKTREDLLGELKSGRNVDILGYPLAPQCCREFIQTDLLGRLGGEHGPVLVVGLGRQKRRRKDLEAIVQAYRQRDRAVEFVQIPEQPFWIDPNDPWRQLASWSGHEGLFRHSADWLDRISGWE